VINPKAPITQSLNNESAGFPKFNDESHLVIGKDGRLLNYHFQSSPKKATEKKDWIETVDANENRFCATSVTSVRGRRPIGDRIMQILLG